MVVTLRMKYAEERAGGMWFQFGVHPVTGMADVSNGNEDIGSAVSVEHANKIADAHNKVVVMYAEMAKAFSDAAPDAFTIFYYGAPKK